MWLAGSRKWFSVHEPENGEFREGQKSGSLDLVEQFGVTFQQLEQLDQSKRRLGFAILIAREGIDAATENFAAFALAFGVLSSQLGETPQYIIDVAGHDGRRARHDLHVYAYALRA